MGQSRHENVSTGTGPASQAFVVWTDTPEGSTDRPIRASAAYYTASSDGGLTWSPAERLAADLAGEWGANAIAGTDSAAIALLSRGETIHASSRGP